MHISPGSTVYSPFSLPRPTQPSISSGLVNEDQLQLGKAKAGMIHSLSGQNA